MRIGVVFNDKNAKTFTLKLIDENGIEKINIDAAVPAVNTDKISYIKVGMPMLGFEKPSVLTLLFGLDGSVEPIETFEVRLPIDDVERSSLLTSSDA
jgi:hypothetical protein